MIKLSGAPFQSSGISRVLRITSYIYKITHQGRRCQSFAGAIVRTLSETTEIPAYQVAAEPAIIILGFLLAGTIIGFLLIGIASWVKNRDSLLIVILGTISLDPGLTGDLKLSPLLANMMVGFLIINKAMDSDLLFQAVEKIEEPIFARFFNLAGAHFDLMVFKMVGSLAFLIVASRFSDKFIGTRCGAALSRAPAMVRKYLGYGLLPTAGGHLGPDFYDTEFYRPELFEIMFNAVLGAVFIREIVVPPFVKFALLRCARGPPEIAYENKSAF